MYVAIEKRTPGPYKRMNEFCYSDESCQMRSITIGNNYHQAK